MLLLGGQAACRPGKSWNIIIILCHDIECGDTYFEEFDCSIMCINFKIQIKLNLYLAKWNMEWPLECNIATC